MPMVLLATAATVIASQAVITGAFSVAITGRPPRLSAAVADRAHVGVDDRPDLRAVDQRRADGGCAHPGVRVPQFGGARDTRSEWRSPERSRSPPSCSSTSPTPDGGGRSGGAGRRRPPAGRRPDVRRGEPHQARARCVAAAVIALIAFTVMTTWQRGRDIVSAARRRRRARCASSSTGCMHRPPLDRVAGHRDLPQPRQGNGAARDARQRRTQPRLARARHDPVGRDRDGAAGSRLRADRRSTTSVTTATASCTSVARYGYMERPNVPARTGTSRPARDRGTHRSGQRLVLPAKIELCWATRRAWRAGASGCSLRRRTSPPTPPSTSACPRPHRDRRFADPGLTIYRASAPRRNTTQRIALYMYTASQTPAALRARRYSTPSAVSRLDSPRMNAR